MAKPRPRIYQKAKDAYLSVTKTDITAVHLVKNYDPADDFATMTGAKSVANIAISQADMSIVTSGDDRKLVINPKSNLNKTKNSSRHVVDIASGGSATTVVKTGAGWTVNQFAGKVVHITSGTGSGQKGRIASNTADTLTIEKVVTGINKALVIEENPFATAPDATSNFEILDDIWAVYVSGSEIVYEIDETTDKAIDAASGDQISVSGTSISIAQLVGVEAA